VRYFARGHQRHSVLAGGHRNIRAGAVVDTASNTDRDRMEGCRMDTYERAVIYEALERCAEAEEKLRVAAIELRRLVENEMVRLGNVLADGEDWAIVRSDGKKLQGTIDNTP
jgi:hypothetical protein